MAADPKGRLPLKGLAPEVFDGPEGAARRLLYNAMYSVGFDEDDNPVEGGSVMETAQANPIARLFGLIPNDPTKAAHNSAIAATLIAAYGVLKIDRGVYDFAQSLDFDDKDVVVEGLYRPYSRIVFPAGVQAIAASFPEDLVQPDQRTLSLRNLSVLTRGIADAMAVSAVWGVGSFEKRFWPFINIENVTFGGFLPTMGWEKALDTSGWQHANLTNVFCQGVDGTRAKDGDTSGTGEQFANTKTLVHIDASGGWLPTQLTMVNVWGMNADIGVKMRGSPEGLAMTACGFYRVRDGLDLEATEYDEDLGDILGTDNASGRPGHVVHEVHVAAYRHALKVRGFKDSTFTGLMYRNEASTEAAGTPMIAFTDTADIILKLRLRNYSATAAAGLDISGATHGAAHGNNGNLDVELLEFEGAYTKGVYGTSFNRDIRLSGFRQADTGATFSVHDIDPVLKATAELPTRLCGRYIRRTDVPFGSGAGAAIPFGETPIFEAFDVLSGAFATDITMPAGQGWAGLYLGGRFIWAANATGQRQVKLYKVPIAGGGATLDYLGAPGPIVVAAHATEKTVQVVPEIFVPADPGDQFFWAGEHDAGVSLNLLANTTMTVRGG